ncbi:Guanylate kinase [bioreactor metagenome]|uniref:Guanylate kinase n=1 Tax=bioreactor metagenome TaxID=1076179 RepID=A0A645BYV5_9ZZZZ
MNKQGTIIVLSGPSGVGKSTLVGRVRREMPELQFSISCTTRPPRTGESHGVHYYFLNHDEFAERIGRGEFVEHAQVFANRYGTLKSEVLERVRVGNSVILDIDVQGALQIRKAAESDPELRRSTVFVFIGPPSVEVLEERLRGRATDSEEQIRLRLETARHELSFWKSYDYLVVNGDLDTAAAEMTGLFQSFSLRTACMPEGLFG